MFPLPIEIQVHIIKYLPLQDFLSLSQCNKTIHSLCTDDFLYKQVNINTILGARRRQLKTYKSHKHALQQRIKEHLRNQTLPSSVCAFCFSRYRPQHASCASRIIGHNICSTCQRKQFLTESGALTFLKITKGWTRKPAMEFLETIPHFTEWKTWYLPSSISGTCPTQSSFLSWKRRTICNNK